MLSKQRTSSNAARTNFLSHPLVKCKLILKNARSNLTAILNKREVFSHVSTSVLMQIYLRFCLKALTLMLSKMILKSYSTLSTELLLTNKTADLLSKFIRSLLVPKKTLLLMKELRRKVTLKIGLLNSKEKCKRPWERSVNQLLKTVSACHLENSLIATHLKYHYLVFSSSGLTEFKRLFQKARRLTSNLILIRKRRKMMLLWPHLPLCVLMKVLSPSWSVQRSKHLWPFKFINVINSMKSSNL